LFSVLGDLPHAIHSPFPLVGRGPAAGEFGQRRVNGADQEFGAQGVTTLESPLRGVDRGSANSLIGTDRVIRCRADRRGRAAEVQMFEPLTPGFVSERQIVDRHFDAVPALSLEHLKNGQHAVVEPIGPEQQVYAALHSISPPSSSLARAETSRRAAGSTDWNE